jgi:hypothetical protein
MSHVFGVTGVMGGGGWLMAVGGWQDNGGLAPSLTLREGWGYTACQWWQEERMPLNQ